MIIGLLALALFIRAAIGLIQKQPARRPIVAAVLVVFAGCALIGSVSSSHLSNLRSKREWPTTTGKIIESRIVGDKAIAPYVVYSYDVEGAPYLGTSDLGTPAFGNKSKRLNEAETLISEYPVGKEILVHFNAADPQQSFILSAIPWNAYAQAGVWMFLCCAAAILFYLYAFRPRSQVSARG